MSRSVENYGMQVAVVGRYFSTERFIPTGMSTKNQKFLLHILNF